MTEPATLTPERQQAAAQVASVFNSLHNYLSTMQHKNANGDMLMTKQLEIAHMHVDDATHWAIKHVLTFGLPPVPVAPPADVPANPDLPTDSPAPSTESI